MTKFIETFFRHKFLLILPVVLITTLVTGYTLVSAPVYYESVTGIWVDRPAYLANAANSDWNPYLSAGVNQSTRLNELLRTQNFLNDIVRRTVLAPLLSKPQGTDRVDALIASGLSVSANGHLIVIRMKTENAQLSYGILTAVVSAFRDNAAADRINQASLATSFYESRLSTANDDLAQLTNAARQYMAANPGALGTSPGANPAAVLRPSDTASPLQALTADPQLLDLQSRIQSKQAEVDGLRKSLDQARQDASASLDGQELGFQVVDPPQVPTVGGRDLKKRIITPAAALIGSLAFSAALLVLLTMSDRSVRGLSDIGLARVIGEVPELKLKRRTKNVGVIGTRRAIAFIAGAALPAPKGAK
jgi:uncharacterized protein involved in exopolysaccharide biosynthesis